MSHEHLDQQLQQLRIDKARKQPRRSGGRWKWFALVAVAAVASFGVYVKSHAPREVKTARVEQDAAAGANGVPLVTASGYVVPRHKVEVSSKIIGRVRDLKIHRGDRVNKGDILLTLEDEEYVARVRSTEAQVAMLRARLEELRTGARPQEIEAAKAAVAASTATLQNATLEMQRMEALDKKGAVSKQETDRARAALDVAKARLDADRKNAELVKIGPREEQIRAAEAQLKEAEANLQLAKTELGFTVIEAPITGTILEKLAEQGELVTNTNFGGTRGAKSSVVTMADLSDLQVEIDVNETDLAKVQMGQKTEIRLDANPDVAYTGEVDEISPQADRQKGTVQVKVKIDKPDAAVMTELNARVTFLGAAPESGVSGKPRLWVPKAAVIRDDKGDRVWVLVNGQAVTKRIVLGTESERGLEVKEGLEGSETLIVNPPDTLVDGIRVVAAP